MGTASSPRRAVVLYHYLHPDPVVSSLHFSQLCVGLAERGWLVEAISANRGCRDESLKYEPHTLWSGVDFHHLWRPAWPQARSWGRLLTALWMLTAWSLQALRHRPPPDALIIGTDPILSVLCLFTWRWRYPRLRIAHWCFDLYPEAAIEDGILARQSPFVRLLSRLLQLAYNRCTLLADIGSCMRHRLTAYGSPARQETVTPWALEEPPAPLETDLAERSLVFGDARLALLYSGTYGRAHDLTPLWPLLKTLEPHGVRFAASVQGNRMASLRDAGVHLVDFAPLHRLSQRLGAADIHVVSLRQNWTGTVVPSKFFGAIAAGRPILFIGSEESAIARWIHQHNVGWVLTPSNTQAVASALHDLVLHPDRLPPLFHHCHAVYHQCFGRQLMLDRWHTLLSDPTAGFAGV